MHLARIPELLSGFPSERLEWKTANQKRWGLLKNILRYLTPVILQKYIWVGIIWGVYLGTYRKQQKSNPPKMCVNFILKQTPWVFFRHRFGKTYVFIKLDHFPIATIWRLCKSMTSLAVDFSNACLLCLTTIVNWEILSCLLKKIYLIFKHQERIVVEHCHKNTHQFHHENRKLSSNCLPFLQNCQKTPFE